MTAQSRNSGYRTVTSNTTFTYTTTHARMREGRNIVYNISQPPNRSGQQDDGTMATKHVSKILNSTLKAQGWITFTKSPGLSSPSPASLKINLEMGSSYLHFFRVGNKTYCNGFRIKTYMTGPIFLGCFSKLGSWNQDKVDEFVYNSMDSVPEVLASITNNLKFNYILKGRWETSLLKVSLISRKEVAIQLYEGCWMPMKQTSFRTLFNAGAGKQNKFSTISPEELYFVCTGEHLTNVQIKYMYAYLDQNTSTKLVTKRSLELLDGLPEMFPTRVKKFDFTAEDDTRYNVRMIVKGNELDWSVCGNVNYEKVVSGRQNVNSQVIIDIRNFNLAITKPNEVDSAAMPDYHNVKGWSDIKKHSESMEKNPNWRYDLSPKNEVSGISGINLRRSNGAIFFCEKSNHGFVALSGICIDQSNVDVSIGDQFASRVMAFLNDTASFDRVSTMRSYKKMKPKFRVDFDALSKLQIPSFY
tara:strand:- start:2818 stop:4233 length:1416 start_codon:yes stop_codon:yes gene_type:complete